MPTRINGKHRRSSKAANRKLTKLAYEHNVTNQKYLGCVRNYLESLDCPRALTVWLLFANNEHDQLAKLGFNPDKFDSLNFIPSYKASFLFSKHQTLKTSFDKKKEALLKFERFELHCKEINHRFRNLATCDLFTGSMPGLHSAVRVKIAKILGSFDVEEFLSSADWGPGASTLLKGRYACSSNKFQLETGITRDLKDLLDDSGFFSREGFSPLWSELRVNDLQLYVGNRLEFVPKSSSIDRPIATEPGLNLWFQKAIGSMIRKRLSKWGINLNSQQINQRLAKTGSLLNLLSTVDFSSASDSIARALVEDLLPPRWYFLMNLCRSHYGVYPESSVPILWEKFSSMGNGFTFELESLIFFAVTLCVCEEDSEFQYIPAGNISVFGDDVILPSCYFQRFSDVCSFYGFIINGDKSFTNSDFRESCGEHYYRGTSCKPFYLKDRIRKASDVYLFHNFILRDCLLYYGRDKRFKYCCDFLKRMVPKQLRLFIPDGVGDGGFISSFDEACPSRCDRGIEGYFYRNIKLVSKPVPFDGLGMLLSRLWDLEGKDSGLTEFFGVTPLQWVSLRSSFRTFEGLNLRYNELDFSQTLRRTSDGNFAFQRDYVSLRLQSGIIGIWKDLGPWL